MPNKDGTGPCGEGPKTGRGCGDCETDAPAEKAEAKPEVKVCRPCKPRRRCCGR